MATPHIRPGPRFVEAVAWVTRRHADQARKGGSDVPYLSHLLAVAALVLEDGGDEDDAVIALCHDLVEDQGGHDRLREIRVRFGDRVADAVAVLSDSAGHHAEAKEPWPERKSRLLAQLAGPEATESVLRVAAADKLHNARTILVALRSEGPRVWERFRPSPAELVWFYRSVADLLADRHPGSANVAELDRVVDELAEWAGHVEVSRSA